MCQELPQIQVYRSLTLSHAPCTHILSLQHHILGILRCLLEVLHTMLHYATVLEIELKNNNN